MEKSKKNPGKKSPSRIKSAKEKIEKKKNIFLEFLSAVARGDQSYGIVLDKIIRTVKVFIISTRKFLDDECLTKASSITYTTIVSLIPTLTVALTVYSVFNKMGTQKDELFRRISIFMLEHNIKLNIDPFFSAISELVENAGKIGGISAAIMIFSATAVLRTLEKSLNDIWKIKQQRPFHIKIIYYWAALTLGPVMLVAGTTIAAQLSEIFTEPHFRSAYIQNDDNIWIVGNKARIMQSADKNFQFNQIKEDSIDFNNQKVFTYSPSGKYFQLQDYGMEILEYKKIKFTDIQFIEETGWAVGNQGVILHTYNGGKSWVIQKWGSFGFNDIHMLDRDRGFIACDNGAVFATMDGGQNWNIMEWEDVMNSFLSIRFFGRKGIITASGGLILRTDDGGKTWDMEKISEAKRKDHPVNINNAFFISEDNIWLLASEGIMLHSVNGGKSWKTHRFKEIDYQDAFFFSQKEGIVGGKRGTLISTSDGGESWRLTTLPTSCINTFLFKNNRLWALGDNGMAQLSLDKGKTWKGLEGNSVISFLINFMAPFIFIWLLFFILYIMLPNTKVPFKEAAIGSAFTGSVWVVFILLFMVYTKAFANSTFAIYGALASIPLFLLMVYASSLIVLYGAEVSYTLMHPEMYTNLYIGMKDRKDIHVYYGVSIIHYIYRKFEDGRRGTTYRELSKLCVYNSEEVDFFVKKFIDEGMIIQDNDLGYIPGNASRNIRLADIVNSVHHISLEIPHGARKSPLKDYMAELFGKMGASRTTIIGDVTLKEVIKKTS